MACLPTAAPHENMPPRRAAERERQYVWDAIRVQPRRYNHDNLWSPAAFDVYGWLVVQRIMAVEKVIGEEAATP